MHDGIPLSVAIIYSHVLVKQFEVRDKSLVKVQRSSFTFTFIAGQWIWAVAKSESQSTIEQVCTNSLRPLKPLLAHASPPD
jgi:hypothetical protein